MSEGGKVSKIGFDFPPFCSISVFEKRRNDLFFNLVKIKAENG